MLNDFLINQAADLENQQLLTAAFPEVNKIYKFFMSGKWHNLNEQELKEWKERKRV